MNCFNSRQLYSRGRIYHRTSPNAATMWGEDGFRYRDLNPGSTFIQTRANSLQLYNPNELAVLRFVYIQEPQTFLRQVGLTIFMQFEECLEF
jgi:hypothetical protein